MQTRIFTSFRGDPGRRHARRRAGLLVRRPATTSATPGSRKSDAFDALVRERFGAAVDAALARPGRRLVAPRRWRCCYCWTSSRATSSAAARAFAGDARAVDREGTRRHRRRPPLRHHRARLRLPALRACRKPADAGRVGAPVHRAQAEDPRQADGLDRTATDVIRRFGRFPHRNAALGRASTAESWFTWRSARCRFLAPLP